jgi:hypothetical protein
MNITYVRLKYTFAYLTVTRSTNSRSLELIIFYIGLIIAALIFFKFLIVGVITTGRVAWSSSHSSTTTTWSPWNFNLFNFLCACDVFSWLQTCKGLLLLHLPLLLKVQTFVVIRHDSSQVLGRCRGQVQICFVLI